MWDSAVSVERAPDGGIRIDRRRGRASHGLGNRARRRTVIDTTGEPAIQQGDIVTSRQGRGSGGRGIIGARLGLGGTFAICVTLLGGCVGAASPAVTNPGESVALATAAVSGPTTAPSVASSGGLLSSGGSCLASAQPSGECAVPGGPLTSPGPSQPPSSPPATPRATATPLPRPTATVPPATTATPPGAAALVVTPADSGTTLHLVVGQQFLVDLGSTVDWSVAVADQAIVRRVPGVLVIRGAQGIYSALAPGTTILSAIGSPICSSGACPQFRIAFSLTIVVG